VCSLGKQTSLDISLDSKENAIEQLLVVKIHILEIMA
jgi:hypothetical protein